MPEEKRERTLIVTRAEYEMDDDSYTLAIYDTPEEAAYAMLVAGLLAVLELDSTTVADFNELTENVMNMWSKRCSDDNEGLLQHQLMHIAELQSEGRLRR